MSVGAEPLLYARQPLKTKTSFSAHRKVHNPGIKHVSGSVKKYSRSMSSCVPSSSCEALRYAVAALNRLDDFNCEKIGAGFFSEVFKVTHRTTGQVMVLKMNTSLSNRPNMLREVQLMNRLSHHNILRFMGVCVHEGQLHALTEYINGGSLEQFLQNKKIDLPWETRIKLSLDIARGMSYLHSRGVFHRDLTSKNVLIKINSEDMIAVIGDFGLAEKIPDSRDRSQRLPIVGSPYWMAPECLHGKWYNEKADVFSYGIILCEIIARVEADPDILPRTENFGVDYVTFSEMCPDCPPQFLEIAFSSCRIDPDSRPSFKEIVCQLEAFLNLISSMSGGSNLFYPPIVYSPCRDDGDNIDSVRAIFAHGWTRSTLPSHKIESDSFSTPTKVPNSNLSSPVTPKHIGEVMSIQDPHYKPNSSSQNPFASLPRFWKGKKFLELSMSDIDLSHSVNLALMSPKYAPTPPGTPVSHQKLSSMNVCHTTGKVQSKSLPTSPVLQRKSRIMYPNSTTVEVPDSPRSVSPGPTFSPPSSLSPFEPDDTFSDYNSVQEQMSDCKLDDSISNQYPEVDKMHLGTVAVPRESSTVVTFRTKTPSLCAKLRRLSGESGFFSVGDRNSNCDLSLDSYHNQDDLSSWATDSSAESHLNDSPSDMDEHSGCSSRKRPSSIYSDDSCYCCGGVSHTFCETRLNPHNVASEVYSAIPYINLPNSAEPEVQTSASEEVAENCRYSSSDSSCCIKSSGLLKDVSSHDKGIRSDLAPVSALSHSTYHLSQDVSSGLSKTCEKGNKVVKCMRTSPEV